MLLYLVMAMNISNSIIGLSWPAAGLVNFLNDDDVTFMNYKHCCYE